MCGSFISSPAASISGLLEGTPNTILGELSEKLSRATGARWLVSLARNADAAAPTLREQAQTHEERLKERARADTLVKAALAVFPGAEIIEVREPGLPRPTAASISSSDRTCMPSAP